MEAFINTNLPLDLHKFKVSMEELENSKEKGRLYTAVPHEYLTQMGHLDDESFGRLIRGLVYYSVTKEFPHCTGTERYHVQQLMDRERKFKSGYEKISKLRSEAGKKGAQARWGKSGNCDGASSDTSDGIPTEGYAGAHSAPYGADRAKNYGGASSDTYGGASSGQYYGEDCDYGILAL